METQPGNLKRLNASCELLNYRSKKTPCSSVCIKLKEMIEKQNQLVSDIMAEQKNLKEQLLKLQDTTEHQNKVIVEMLADNKILLQTHNKTRESTTTLSKAFPLKTEEDLQKIEAGICEANEEKYISAVKYLIDGNAIKNLERIFSRELCIMYNTDGICGKKSLKDYKNLYKIVIAAIGNYSLNAYKEFRSALQVVKKRHFRVICAKKKQNKKLSN